MKMNREQRRAYARKIKHSKTASECPICHQKTEFYTSKEHLDLSDKLYTVIKCVACDEIVRSDHIIDDLVPPGLYLPLPLSEFDKVVEEQKKNLVVAK